MQLHIASIITARWGFPPIRTKWSTWPTCLIFTTQRKPGASLVTAILHSEPPGGNYFTCNLHGAYLGKVFIDRLISKCLIVFILSKNRSVKKLQLHICAVFAESEVRTVLDWRYRTLSVMDRNAGIGLASGQQRIIADLKLGKN